MTDSGQTPVVSVLVTVFNRSKYLSACLDSILASSWQDFEVIVVDDSSTDQSPEIAAEYASRDPRVRAFRNETNLGDYPNRARAASLARGTFLKYVDSDDLIYRYGLATMVESMLANPHAALGVSHSMPEDEEPYPWVLSSAEAWRKEFLGSGCMGCGPTGSIIRAEALQEVGGFRNWGILNDTDLWYRMASRWPIVLLSPGLVWWRRHEGQEFDGHNAALTYIRMGFQLSVESLSSSESPLNEGETRAALARARRRYARRVISLATRGQSPAIAGRLAREARLTVKELISGFRRLP